MSLALRAPVSHPTSRKTLIALHEHAMPFEFPMLGHFFDMYVMSAKRVWMKPALEACCRPILIGASIDVGCAYIFFD
jgi:hypothetical protein